VPYSQTYSLLRLMLNMPMSMAADSVVCLMAKHELAAAMLHLQHDLGLIVQLLGLLADRLVLEDFGVAAVGVAPPQLPCLQESKL
jgi:hypothetical protein